MEPQQMHPQQMSPQDMSYEQLMKFAEETMNDPQKKAAAMAVLNQKAPDGMHEKLSAVFNDLSSEKKQQIRDISKFECDEYMKGDGYKNGQTDTVGYIQCCDIYGFCGGSNSSIRNDSNGSISCSIIILFVLLAFFWYKKM